MFGKKSKNENETVENPGMENPEVVENRSVDEDQAATDYAEGMQAESETVGEKKPEAIEREEVVEGAKKHAEEKKKHVDHQHVLMGPKYKMNLLEISHRDIEEIEKARFRIMAKHEGEEAVEEFKNFVFEKLLVK